MEVLMQAFYWNCMRDVNKSWYQVVGNKATKLKERGIDIIWLPPPTRGMDSRGMGYDIKEHYNLNSAFGKQDELVTLLNKLRKLNLLPVADTVMAHMIGGQKQYNPYYEELIGESSYTYTRFPEPEFPKNYKHFCRKCGDCDKMKSDFGEKICHYADDGYMKDGFINWGQWLKEEIGFAGFRLDYVKDIPREFIREWAEAVEAEFLVGEYWSGNRKLITDWIEYTGVPAFNFPLFYALQSMCDEPKKFDMRTLEEYQLERTISFVSNHDVSRKEPIKKDKELAYAYILLFTRRSCIFWKDYYNYSLKQEIDNLLAIRQQIEEPFTVEYADYDLIVGDKDGYQIYINKSQQEKIYQGVKIPPRDYIWRTQDRRIVDFGGEEYIK